MEIKHWRIAIPPAFKSYQSVINGTDSYGDTDSVRCCLATHLAIRPVNVNMETNSFETISNWLSFESSSELRECKRMSKIYVFIGQIVIIWWKHQKVWNSNKPKETIMLYGLWESLTVPYHQLFIFLKENLGLVLSINLTYEN